MSAWRPLAHVNSSSPFGAPKRYVSCHLCRLRGSPSGERVGQERTRVLPRAGALDGGRARTVSQRPCLLGRLPRRVRVWLRQGRQGWRRAGAMPTKLSRPRGHPLARRARGRAGADLHLLGRRADQGGAHGGCGHSHAARRAGVRIPATHTSHRARGKIAFNIRGRDGDFCAAVIMRLQRHVTPERDLAE